MWAPVVAAMFLLFYQTPQCNGQSIGSGDASGMLTPAPGDRCTPTQSTDVCSIIRSSAMFQLTNTLQIDEIFATLRDGTIQSSHICRQFFVFSVCFYSFRDCDPSGNSQLLICDDMCPLITSIYNDCVVPEVVLWLINGTNSSEVQQFLQFSLSFDCSKPETYTIDEVDISTRTCSKFEFIKDLFPVPKDGSNDALPHAVKIGLGVGIPIVIIVLLSALILLVILVFKLCKSKTDLKRKLTEKEPYRNEYRSPLGELEDMMENAEDIKLSTEERCYYVERFDKGVIAYDQLKIAETIGEGTFGVVSKGQLANSQPVAIKTAKNLSSKQELRSLLNESLLMKRFDHLNIVGLLGVCFDTPDGYPYLVLPFMANGNIRDYLKGKRVHLSDTDTFPEDVSLKTLVTMCSDVAKGMEYLANNKFVHRDLAARNCMLDENGVVRVGDFGLARDVYSHLYYRTDKHSRIPVKWSAPEMLKDGLCTEKSDVWSYGVVCWEVFCLGSTPYPGIVNYDIPQYVANGERLKKPTLCPQDMYVIVASCWEMKPEERPAFKQLVASVALFC